MWWQKSSSTYPTKASYAAAHGRTVTYCDIVTDTHLSRLRGDDKHLSPCVQLLLFPLSAANLYIVHQPPPHPLPSHPAIFPSRLTLAAHHPISQPRHHRKANIKHQTPKRAGTQRDQDTRVSALILHSARIRCLITPIYPGLVKARRRWEGVTTERCRDGSIGWKSALQDRRLRRYIKSWGDDSLIYSSFRCGLHKRGQEVRGTDVVAT